MLWPGEFKLSFAPPRKAVRPDGANGREKKVSGTFCAEHPEGRSGKRFLTPFSPGYLPPPAAEGSSPPAPGDFSS